MHVDPHLKIYTYFACMATMISSSPSSSFFFFFFLVFFYSTLATAEINHFNDNLPNVFTSKAEEVALRRRSSPFFHSRKQGMEKEFNTKTNTPSSSSSSPSPKQERMMFNASAHEVPSGPNPISNR